MRISDWSSDVCSSDLAGLNAFGGKGYHSTGVREICAEAKLTERYFYESFRNREALFQAVYEHAIETVRTAVMEAIARSGRDVRTLARTAIRAFLETLRNRSEEHTSELQSLMRISYAVFC